MTVTSSDDSQVGDLAHRLFADLADPQEIIAGCEGWREALWSAIEEAMLTRAWASESMGGAGLSAEETGRIAAAAGYHALAVPLVETMTAHHWAARAGLALPDGPIALAPSRLDTRMMVDDAGRVSGHARDLPWDEGPLLVAAEHSEGLTLALVASDACEISHQPSAAGIPRVALRMADVGAEATGHIDAAPIDVLASAAALRAAQIGGALRWSLEAALNYAGERQAFGRPIAKFQAVQHHIARLAGEVCATEVAAAVAMQSLDGGSRLMEAAAAKVRSDEAASEGALMAHQVFGAIGFTNEHVLHRYTTRMLSWRDDFGSGPEWAAYLGRMFAKTGSDGFWQVITSGYTDSAEVAP